MKDVILFGVVLVLVALPAGLRAYDQNGQGKGLEKRIKVKLEQVKEKVKDEKKSDKSDKSDNPIKIVRKITAENTGSEKTVPEPATLLLLGGAAVSLVGVRKLLPKGR